ncbi:MAG: purine-binding chemotaxis protein CheW [Planctomycetaceae bacterium]|nr:purine-binding chemotaxis protein CheW [Planctomycetaceae bacterium]
MTTCATPSVEDARNTKSGSQRNLAGKYLTFQLAEEQFGLQILKVREIIGVMKVTPIPNSPKSIRGVINLRGKIVPVMDLRAKLELPTAESDRKNCIIVTEVERDGESIEMGILVDSVCEVLDIPSGEIEPPPALGDDVDKTLILGMAKAGKDVKILLDVDQVVASMGTLKLTVPGSDKK